MVVKITTVKLKKNTKVRFLSSLGYFGFSENRISYHMVLIMASKVVAEPRVCIHTSRAMVMAGGIFLGRGLKMGGEPQRQVAGDLPTLSDCDNGV